MTRQHHPPENPWPNLQKFIDSGGQISIGESGPVRCSAVAADEHTMYVALSRRTGESLVDLLHRLDRALDKALSEEVFTDEINS